MPRRLRWFPLASPWTSAVSLNFATYNSTQCYDLGAVQTNYAVSFTTDPPSTGTIPGTAMSPAPAVTVTESGNALTGGSASVSVTDANSDLTTSPATASTSTSNGQAAFSNLIFTGATSNDTLTAALVLNTSPALSLTAPSTSFSVGAATVPPAITSVNNTTFAVGALGSFTVKATGSPAPTLSESGTLPSGVSFNSAIGVLSGTPAAGTGGTYSITFTASNGTSPNAVQSFTLTVDQAPTVTSTPSAVFVLGTAGSFTLTATGFPAPTFSLTSGTLPKGVTFNAAGVLSGTPGAGTDGTYALQFTASNGVGSNAVQNFTLTVGQVPAITSAVKTTFTVGTAGTFTMTASGYPAPTFSETGALPSGVTLSAAGVLSGAPAAGTGGVYSISVTATNAAGASTAQTFTLTVDQAPAITSAASTTFTTGTAGSFTVTATGYPAPKFTRTGTLPTGVTFATATGVLSGTPGANAGGSYTLTFTATNSVGTSAAQSFTLTVRSTTARSPVRLRRRSQLGRRGRLR